MKRAWLDALTPKQMLLAHSLGCRLEDEGYEVIITARDYEYTSSLAELIGAAGKTRIVGGYGETLEDKLRADVERMRLLIDIISRWRPCLLISYPSPSACRVAYGLGIPIVILTDSPHSRIVNRLTLPLANAVIVPEAVGVQPIREFLTEDSKVFTFRGVDEVEFLRGFKPDPKVLGEVGLRPEERYYIVRPPEEKASYYTFSPPDLDELMDELSERGRIVFFPRYESQRAHVLGRYRGRVIIPGRAVDTRSLYYYAEAVISGGATMAREAALIGTPSIYMFPRPIEVNEWLKELGFPIRRVVSPDRVLEALESMLAGSSREELRVKAGEILKGLEGPGDVLLDAVRGLNP